MAAKRLILITVPLKNGETHKVPAVIRSCANPNITSQKIPIPQICAPKTTNPPKAFKVTAPLQHFTPPPQKVYKRPSPSDNIMTLGSGGGWKRSYVHDEEDNNVFIDQASYGGDSADDMLDEIRPPRKRQRLTHLSPEEKVNRRKMKNRVAAHMARERRKNFMMELEQKYKRLRYENDGLKSRNEQFRMEIHRLSDENKEIKHQIELLRQETLANKASAASPAANQNVAQTVECTTVGSAASVSAPQQQERVMHNTGNATKWSTAALIRMLGCLLTSLMATSSNTMAMTSPNASSSSCSSGSSQNTTATKVEATPQQQLATLGGGKSVEMQRDWQEIVKAFNMMASKNQVTPATLGQFAKLLTCLSTQLRSPPP